MVAIIAIGDIVRVKGFAEHWVVDSRSTAHPPEKRWRLITQSTNNTRGEIYHSRIVGDGDITVLESSPQFFAGQIVKYRFAYDGKAVVVSDDGDTVRLRYTRQRKRSLSGEIFGSTSFQMDEVECGRGELVAQQLQG